ncbi:putative type IIS restriction enzyme [Streptococcus suis]|nr:putative type IIS restriction enzyme [Streptococcus suis]
MTKADQISGNLPFVMSGVTNTGIVRKIGNDMRVFPKNSITIDIFGNVFYRSYQFAASDDVGVYWNSTDYPELAMIYIASSLQKALQGKFDFGNKLRSSKSHDLLLYLPTINNKLAYSYMESYIKTLEAERIETLEAYLTVTGLKDYHLTKNDEKILDTFTKLTDTESRVEYLGILWEKFPVASLFDIQTSRSVDKGALELSDKPKKYQFIGRTSQNNGVQGYLDYLGFAPNPKNTFSVIQIGENVAQFRNKEWYGSQNLFVLNPNNEKVIDANLFFTTCLNMSLLQFSSGYTNYPTLSKLKELELVLPVKEQQIDYTFMSDFIKVIEKLVIKDLVEWTDKKIEATKEVVRYGE